MGRIENPIQRDCLALLQTLGVLAWRQNTGAVKIDGRFMRFGVKGQADIQGVLPGGTALFVECKSPKGVQTSSQKAFESSVTNAGAVYWLVRSAADLAEVLEAWLQNRRPDNDSDTKTDGT